MAISRSCVAPPTVTGICVGETSSRAHRMLSRRIGVAATCYKCDELAVAQGPYCVLVGPIDSASKETLEALYFQARDAYYSGKPIIVDDMFDRVEMKLRWYGSKSIVKYPRCSLRRQSAYADAEEDPQQTVALASIWMLIFAFGISACFVPMICTVALAYQNAFEYGHSFGSQASGLGSFSMANHILFLVLGCMAGYPVASASVGVLQGLWKKELVALRGACPNCGEEVFAFIRSDQSNSNPHRASCHVCDSNIEFRTKVQHALAKSGRRWVYGRVYLVQQ